MAMISVNGTSLGALVDTTLGGVTSAGSSGEHGKPVRGLTKDYLCKWCLSYVGQRRQFCSADCAAQFKLCQKRRDQRQDLNISVDYYGNVKLSIQGLPISSTDELSATKPFPGSNGLIGRRGRRRKRCRNCAKLLSDDTEDEFCDDRCETMETERSKKEFVNIFQQKEVAERRRIRKWLTDAQDQYTKQEGDGDLLEGFDVTSGPAALNPLPIIRTPFLTIPETPKPTLSYQSQQTKRITGTKGGVLLAYIGEGYLQFLDLFHKLSEKKLRMK